MYLAEQIRKKIEETRCPITLTVNEWQEIIYQLKKSKMPISMKLEKSIRDHVNFEIDEINKKVLSDVMGYDHKESETQEIPIINKRKEGEKFSNSFREEFILTDD